MEYLGKLLLALFPAVLILGMWGFFLRKSRRYQQDYLAEMKSQNEKLERIAKALEHKNGTDVK